jgi:hypothetical protein
MMPFVRPAPLSAWTLVGVRMAKPQPRESTCCCQSAPNLPPNPKPNSRITGTDSRASAGVVSVSLMSTLICGHAELSTWPTSCFVTTSVSPTFCFFVSTSSHFTRGVSLGTRP